MTLTPTEHRILHALSDGRPHHLRELLALIDPGGMASLHTLQVHVSNIRSKLPPGEWIDCVIHRRKAAYRHFRLLDREGNANGRGT